MGWVLVLGMKQDPMDQGSRWENMREPLDQGSNWENMPPEPLDRSRWENLPELVAEPVGILVRHTPEECRERMILVEDN